MLEYDPGLHKLQADVPTAAHSFNNQDIVDFSHSSKQCPVIEMQAKYSLAISFKQINRDSGNDEERQGVWYSDW